MTSAVTKSRTHEDIPKFFYLWLMCVPFVVHLGFGYFDKQRAFFDRWIESELGIIENLTVFVLLPAALMLLYTGKNYLRKSKVLLAIWFVLAALVCIGFGGEEASWGQHWFGWESPEYFESNNRQGETNFHNFDIQIGRTVKAVLTLAIIIGGLILPLVRKADMAHGDTRFIDNIVGTRSCVPVAFWVFFVRLIERFKTWFDLDWLILAVNLKELQELYIALFLFIYAWATMKRATKFLDP